MGSKKKEAKVTKLSDLPEGIVGSIVDIGMSQVIAGQIKAAVADARSKNCVIEVHLRERPLDKKETGDFLRDNSYRKAGESCENCKHSDAPPESNHAPWRRCLLTKGTELVLDHFVCDRWELRGVKS